jgi:HD-GYP domain-containing protein (c-di-GMP phosphodiesterase class II)
MHSTLVNQPHLLPAVEGAIARYHLGTAQHSTRVAQMAAITGEAFGLDGDDLEALSWAAVLHDVGKLSVPEAVLTKDGPLTAAEWSQVHQHPKVGADLLLTLSPRLAPIAAGVGAHHERWDGTGYPDGLAGRGIPLAGRILAVADVYDSVTHLRSYRHFAFSPDEALALLDMERGTHFDPDLVDLFLALHAEDRFDPSST